MILIDTNILIYAINRDSPMHEPAQSWLNKQLSAGTRIGLPWLVIVAFVRLTTNHRVFPNPLSAEDAIQAVDEWLAIPHVSPLNPGDDHWQALSRLLLRVGTAGNLTNDAHLAAIAIDNACVICSADNDFKRFQGVQHFNPIADEDAVHEPMLSY